MKCASVQKETKVLYPKESVDIMRVQNMCKCGKRTCPPGPKAALTQTKNACVGDALRGKSKPHMQKSSRAPSGAKHASGTHSRRVQRRREAVEDQHKETGPINANSTTKRMRTPGANYNSDNSSAYSRRVQQQRSQCTLEAQSVEKAAPHERTKMGVDNRHTYNTQYITTKLRW